MGNILSKPPVAAVADDLAKELHLRVAVGSVPGGYTEGRMTAVDLLLSAVARMTPQERLSLAGMSLDEPSGEIRWTGPNGVVRLLPVDVSDAE